LRDCAPPARGRAAVTEPRGAVTGKTEPESRVFDRIQPSATSEPPPRTGGADDFISKMKAERPEIAALIDDDGAGLEPAVAGMSRQSRAASLMLFVSMTFSLQREGRHAEALRFAWIQHALASSDPVDRVDSYLEHTQPRNVGDALST